MIRTAKPVSTSKSFPMARSVSNVASVVFDNFEGSDTSRLDITVSQ